MYLLCFTVLDDQVMLNQPQTSHKQITTTAINTPVSKMIPTIPSSASIFTQSYGGPLTLPLPLNPYSAMLCSWSSAWSSLQEAQHKILQHGGVPEGLQANGQSNKGDNSHQGECYVMIYVGKKIVLLTRGSQQKQKYLSPDIFEDWRQRVLAYSLGNGEWGSWTQN